MSDPIAKDVALEKSLLLRQSIFLFGLSMLVLIWAGIGMKIHSDRLAAADRLRSDTANLARAFEESVLRTMQQVDLRLSYLRAAVTTAPPEEWRHHVTSAPLDNDLVFQLSLVDANGRFVTSNIDPSPSAITNLSDRDHFRVHVGANEDRLFISKPLLGRVSKQWSINVSRPIYDAAGGFLGVAVASLSPSYLTRFYETLDLGARGSIALLGSDGVIRASTGNLDFEKADIVDSDFFRHTVDRTEGFYSGPFLNNPDSVTAWRKIRGLPLVVAISGDPATAGSGARTHEYYQIAGALFVSLLIVIATASMIRTQVRLASARAEAAKNAHDVEAKSRELEITLENISQGIVMVGRDGQVLVANRRAAELLNVPPGPDLQAALESRLGSHSMTAEGVATREITIEATAAAPPSPSAASVPSPPKSGLAVPLARVLEVGTSALAGGGLVRTLTDVTQARRREAQMAAASQAAEAANQAKSQFLSTMSHEMRTPLNGVIGALDLLARTRLDDEQHHFVETAMQSGEALLVHINDVLDFSKMEAGKLVLDPAPFSLRESVNSVVTIVTPQAETRGNVFAIAISPDVPDYVVGDPVRVRQILLNLVGNAVKFTRQGRISITVRCIGGTGTGTNTGAAPLIDVVIGDTGPGIPHDRVQNLFQEFSMVDASYSRREGGTGLGLAICKRLVTSMGGTIGVTSVQGRGSEFAFRIPLPRCEAPVAAEKPADDITCTPTPDLDVLLVDDNATNQMVASRMLTAAGHRVVTASDGREALGIASEKLFDVIFMDISMPEMDGLEATKRIRMLPEPLASVPIIALTANAIAGDRERFLAAGMNDYLSKPVRRADIEARLAKLGHKLASNTKATTTSAGKPSPMHPPEAPSYPLVDTGDLGKLAEETAPEIVPLVIEQFLLEMTGRLEEIAGAAARRDCDGLKRAAHALAGASGAVGCTRLRVSAKSIELDCAAGRLDEASIQAAQLPLIADSTAEALRAYLSSDCGLPSQRAAA